jgi:hypothetical protein
MAMQLSFHVKQGRKMSDFGEGGKLGICLAWRGGDGGLMTKVMHFRCLSPITMETIHID